MVVIKKRAQRLADVTLSTGELRVRHTSKDVRIMMVVKLSRREEVTWKSIAFRRRMAIVQVSRDSIIAESTVIGGKIIYIPYNNRFAVPGMINGSGAHAIEAPDGLYGEIRGHSSF